MIITSCIILQFGIQYDLIESIVKIKEAIRLYNLGPTDQSAIFKQFEKEIYRSI